MALAQDVAVGNCGRYLVVRKNASIKALSSLTRGLECEALKPSQCNMANTVVAFTVEPLSPCKTGFSSSAWIPSAKAVRRTNSTA